MLCLTTQSATQVCLTIQSVTYASTISFFTNGASSLTVSRHSEINMYKHIHTYIHTHSGEVALVQSLPWLKFETHIHTYIHTYIHTCIHTCRHIHEYVAILRRLAIVDHFGCKLEHTGIEVASLCVCTYVCINVCMCICLHTCECVRMYLRARVRVCVSICIRLYACSCM
jgi:hypothetical protein